MYTLKTTCQHIQDSAKKVLGQNLELILEPANPKFGADFAVPCFKLAGALKKARCKLPKT